MKPEKNAIEVWCEAVSKASCVPMTDDQAKKMILCIMNEKHFDGDDELLKSVEAKKEWMLSAFWLRVKCCHTYKVTMSLAVFITDAIIGGNFGKMTMMANYLQWFCHKNHLKTIDLDTFCKRVFPWGFPSDDEWQRLWSLQKVDVAYLSGGTSDNILDYSDCGLTIREV